MAVIETWYKCDLLESVKAQPLCGSLFSHNGNANKICVSVTSGGTPVELSGTVSGYVVTSDGTTVPCTGTRSGNVASILLPASAYVPGNVFITIMLTSGTTITTLCAVVATVVESRTDTQVDPGSVVTDWTNTINAALQTVENYTGNIIATPYASLTYPVPLGKYCIYNNLLYRCISPIASSENWTPSHWTQVKLADEVADIKTNLGRTLGRVNLIDGVLWTEDKTINDSGTVQDSSTYKYSDLIPVTNKFYTLYWKLSSYSSVTRVHGYDSNGNWVRMLSKWTVTSVSNNAQSFACGGIAYIRIAIRMLGTTIEYLTGSDTDETIIDGLTDRADAFEAFYLADNHVDVFSLAGTLSDRGISNATLPMNADVVTNSGKLLSPVFHVEPGMILYFTYSMQSGTWRTKFYDKDGYVVGAPLNNDNNMSLKVPSGAYYARVMTSTTPRASAYIYYADSIKKQPRNIYKANEYGATYSTDRGIVNTGAVSQAQLSSNIKATNFIPVEYGTILYPLWEVNSQTFGHAFYDENLTYIEDSFVYSNKLTKMMVVPETAKYVRFTISTAEGKRNEYVLMTTIKEPITPYMFGAVGDGKTDDSTALQDAFDFGGANNIPIYIPFGKYLIENTVNVNYMSTSIFGDPNVEYAGTQIILKTFQQNADGTFPADVDGKQPLVDGGITIGIDVLQPAVNIRNIAIRSNSKTNTDHYDHNQLTAIGLMFDAHADLDSDVYDCHFTALDVAISVRGRNLEINDNLISHCNIGIQVLWDTWQNYEQREINIVNNRFHSCNRNDYGKNDVVYDPSRVCIQFPDFIPATSSRAFTIRNNFADYCGNFFSGNLFGVLLDGNQCYLSRGAFIDSTCKILDESQPLATLDYDDLFPTTPTANRGILAASGNVGTGTNIYASDYVTIPAGTKYIKLNWTISTRVWGHFFWTSNDEPIRGVLAHSDLMAVPEGAAKIRFTVPTSKAANLVVRMLSETWATTTTEGSYADKPIEIKNNSVCGAITTDYSYGLNIMTKAILLQYYDNCIISNNEFTNGVGDVIVLDTCSNVLIDGNKFVSAPSFCDVYSKDAPQGPPTTYTGAGKNYIKMDDVTGERIKRNIAYAIGENYVQTAVTMDGVAYTADSTNNFEVAPQTPPESTEP